MKIIKGKIPGAKKVVIYGPEGIGKSTFASHFPSPVFIDTEGSTKDMDVSRFEKSNSWTMLLEQIRYAIKTPDLCQTLVIDTIDWAEALCVADVCARYGKKGIEDFGYGNGYVYVKEEFGRFLNLLEDVIEKGMHVVLTAHAQLRKFEQPNEMGAYDRWELKLGKKTQSQISPLVKEWADMVLFANYKIFSVAADDKGKKHKAQGGKRVMYTSHHPCWDAKNRYGLADELEFSYQEIASVIEGSYAPVQNHQNDSESIRQGTVPPLPDYMKPETMEEGPNAHRTESKPKSPQNGTPNPEPPVHAEGNPPKEDPRNIPWTPNEKIPRALRELMVANNVCEWEIQSVVASRGYYPDGTPIENYDPGFIDGVLVGAWEQVFDMIKMMREKEAIPFNE